MGWMIEFQAIDTLEQLVNVWPEVHDGLEVILSKCATDCTWTPTDVFNSIASVNALLVVGRDEEGIKGFAVLTFEKDFDGYAGHVWAAYNAGPKDYLTE